MQYVHHFGTERDARNGARNLRLLGPIDAIWLNHNWHLTHHRHPNVSWLYLPSLEPGERGFLITAYLRMWRGPRRGVRIDTGLSGAAAPSPPRFNANGGEGAAAPLSNL